MPAETRVLKIGQIGDDEVVEDQYHADDIIRKPPCSQ